MVIYIAGSIPLFRGKRSNHFRLQRQSKHGAAHLHRDEETPHIHVTLVPIVKGERKRRKREEQTKKRYRKKPTDTVRLCADDIMTRLKLKSYQDTYAVAMAKYGLQRGIDGSKVRHKSTQQYYRDIQKLSDDLKAEVVDLQQQKETAREELRRAKKEIQTEKLKRAATTAAANIAKSVGSLFGSNKVKTLERENTALHREVADHEETIEACKIGYSPCRQTTAGRYGKCSSVTRNFAASLFRNIKYFTLRKLYLCRKWMQKRLQKTTTTGITLPNFDFLA